MKRNRLIYLSLWILSVVGISFFGGTVSYGLFWALTILPVLMLIYLIFVLFGVKIYQELNMTELVSRAPVSYYFTLQNESFLAFSSVRVTFFDFGVDYGNLDKDEEYELLPHQGHRIITNIVFKYRGEYEIGVKNIIITDFLKLFRITYKNPGVLKVNVLPAIVYPEGNLLEEQSLFTSSASCSGPEQRDLLVRSYAPGDSLRSINWKATAKKRELMVSGRISEEHSSVHIFLDTKRYSEEPEKYLPEEDELLTGLITLVIGMVNNHIDVGIHYYSQGCQNIRINDIGRFGEFYDRISTVVFSPDSDGTALIAETRGIEQINDEDVVYFGRFDG